MDLTERAVERLHRLTLRWHAGAAGACLAGALIAVILAPRGDWLWWILVLPVLAAAGFLWQAHREVETGGRVLADENGRLNARAESLGAQVQSERRRRLDSEEALAESERRSEQERMEAGRALAAAEAKAEESRQHHAALQLEVQRLMEQCRVLEKKEAESHERRRIVEGQYRDLEASSRELGAAHTERAGRHRQAMDDARHLRETVEELTKDIQGARGDSERLRAELETARMEAKNLKLRSERLDAAVEEWKQRALAAQEESRRQRVNRALEEELEARKAEIERLVIELDAARSQRELALERSREFESGDAELRDEVDRLRVSLQRREEVLQQLEEESRRQHQEPKEEMIRHFTWKVNYFRENEVSLNFVNDGATVDLFEVRSEPPFECERPVPTTVARGQEARVRLLSRTSLPEEIRIRCRYTIYPQEAVFRIRPAGPVKLERIWD